MKKLHVILSLCSLFLLANCGGGSKEANKQDNEVIAVKLGKVEQQTLNKNILASGMVSTDAQARLSFKIGGVIDKILVEEGQTVVKGQLLATLNLTEIKAQVSQAQEALSKAERDLSRIKNLHKDSVATLEQLQNVTTAYNIAKQNYTIAGFNQSYAEIRASLTGKVIRKMMNEGEIVSPGTPVFMISAMTTNDWIIKVGLADKDWASLQLGDKAQINLDAYPNQTLEGVVTLLADNADMLTGTFECEIKILPKPNIRLATGLLASVELIPSQKQTFKVIPIASLVESNAQKGVVYTVDNQQIARKKEISIAYLWQDKVVVSKGLEDVEQIVVVGSPYLSQGQKVVLK